MESWERRARNEAWGMGTFLAFLLSHLCWYSQYLDLFSKSRTGEFLVRGNRINRIAFFTNKIVDIWKMIFVVSLVPFLAKPLSFILCLQLVKNIYFLLLYFTAQHFKILSAEINLFRFNNNRLNIFLISRSPFSILHFRNFHIFHITAQESIWFRSWLIMTYRQTKSFRSLDIRTLTI